ncbi:hypothetical protein CHS0354_011051 [Potamilus streckersoni]|uniref:Uncharacterized protein n=1 Tax=Potamilus streckersoni TaxID=2493646 RepID=A0AAE0TMD2_9BIVA|nr:hypothetical protein CHS0354_011051 [Potamilus streckersoni]
MFLLDASCFEVTLRLSEGKWLYKHRETPRLIIAIGEKQLKLQGMEFIARLLLFVLFSCENSHGQYFPLQELSSVHSSLQGPTMGPKSGPAMIQAEHSRIFPTSHQFPFPIALRMRHKQVPVHPLSLGIQQAMVPGSALHQSGQISPSLGIHRAAVPGNTIEQSGQPFVNHKQMWPLPTPNLNPVMHQQSSGISMESPLVTPRLDAEVIHQHFFLNHIRQPEVIPFSRESAIFVNSIQQGPVLLSHMQPSSAISNPFQRGSILPNVVRQGPLLQPSLFLTRSPSPLVNRNEHQALSNYLVNDVNQVNRQLPIFSWNIMHPFPQQNLFNEMQVLPDSRHISAAGTGFRGNVYGDINSIQHIPSQNKSESEAAEERLENETEQLEEYFEQREEMGLFPAWNALGFWNFWNYNPEYEIEKGKIIFEPPELDQDFSKGLVKDKSPNTTVGSVSLEKGFNSNKFSNGVHIFDSGVTAGPSSDKRVSDKESDIVENAKESPKSPKV